MQALVMPKWGLTMTQGVVVTWLVDEGADFELGAELVDVETEENSERGRVAGERRLALAGG